MGYQALLFCPDEKTARTVTQVLTELEFNVEACLEPFAAVKKLMGQHFDAVVVDCDNEQNATLLFKSARNSTSNQASLAVAVVEGQAGVAKAFRIGANLVLTKPINIEQSKGTLRVARGLLRKGEPPKPATAAPGTATLSSPIAAPGPATGGGAVPAKPVATKPVAPAKPAVSAKPAAVAATRPAAIPVAKPAAIPARPVPAVAVTKSIMMPAAPVASAHVAAELDKPVVHTNQNEAPPQVNVEDSIPAPAAAASALPEVNKIAPPASFVPKLPVPSDTAVKPAFSASAGSPAATGGGAASAAAPAREALDSHIAEISPENPAAVGDAVSDKPAEAEKNDSSFVGAAPAFTFGGANLPEEKSGKGKKTFVGIAAVVLVGAALYYGWTQYKGATTTPVAVTGSMKPAPAPTKATGSNPAPATSGAAATGSGALPGSQPGANPATGPATGPNDFGSVSQPTAAPTAPISSAPASSKSAGPVSDSTKSDSTKSDSTKPSAALGSANPPTAPLVVKGGKAPALQSSAAAADAPAPSITGIGVADASAPPPDLGSGDNGGPKPVLQTVNISQGVSRGLLIKKVSPNYPPNALTMRIEGAVELTTTISKTGDITHVKVLSGDAQLTKAAVDAVKQWKYKPYLLNGEPVEIQTQITVNFKLPQ